MRLVEDYLYSIVTFTGFISFIFLTSIILLRIAKAISGILHKQVQLCGGLNAWAVITGATDGIGLEYAIQLAQKGYNLLLLSRREEKLNSVMALIESITNCKVRFLAVDFRCTDIYQQIEKELDQLKEVHILVNNVGISYPSSKPEYFTKLPSNYPADMINVNIIATTRMTQLILPRMEKRGQGIIINISSGAALFPTPLGAVYSATKAFVDFMSRGLTKEYESKGIIIQSVLPFHVSTKMTANLKQDYFTATPDEFVKSALMTLGKVDRTAGFPTHKIQYCICEVFNMLSKLTGFDINLNIAFYQMKKLMMTKNNYNSK